MFVVVEKKENTIIDLDAVFRATGVETPAGYNPKSNSVILEVTEKQAQKLSARSGIFVQRNI